MPANVCPAPTEWQRLLREELAGDERERLLQHLSTCETCASEVDQLSWTPPPVPLAGMHAPKAEALTPTTDLVDRVGAAIDAVVRETLHQQDTEQRNLRPPIAENTVAPRIPGYQVELPPLGRGGMGVVYRATHLRLKKQVVLKMILSGEYAGSQERERFRIEAEALARLQHPNIVQVYDAGEHEGRPFFTMEYVAGGSLESKLAGKPIDPLAAARIIRALALAMQAAHERGIVHRDLKPANVLLDADSTPKIADFGLAKQLDAPGLTATNAIQGSPPYMSPEQADGRMKEVGPLSDVYSLGAILYQMLTGRPPFLGATVLDTLDQVREQEPVPPRRLQPRIPRDLETICLKCLEKTPARRYGSAQALADDVARFQAGEPIVARRIGPIARTWKWCKRKPAVAGLMGATVLAAFLGGGIYYIVWSNQRDAATARENRTSQARLKLREVEVLWNQAKSARRGDVQPWELALSAAQAAEEIVKSGDVEGDVRRQVEQTANALKAMVRNQRMVAELEDLKLTQRVATRDGEYDPDQANRAYARIFEKYGIDIRKADDAVAQIASASIKTELTAALEAWIPLRADAEQRRHLAELANRIAEPDDFHRQLRTALAEHDTEALAKLVGADRALRAMLTTHVRDLASTTLSEAVSKLPPMVLHDLGVSLANADAYWEAIAVLWPAQQLYPTDYGINFELASCLQHFDPPQLDDAIRFYTAAIALRPDSAISHYNMGVALEDLKRSDEAIACYRLALKHDPNYDDARNNLGIALAEQGKLDEAIQEYNLSIKHRLQTGVAPKRIANVHDSLGMALYEQGKYEEAIAAFSLAVEYDKNRAGLHGNLGMALARRGRFREALAAYHRALVLFKADDEGKQQAEIRMRQIQYFLQLENRLAEFLEGKAKPRNADQRFAFIMFAWSKELPATAARLHAEAMAANSALTKDPIILSGAARAAALTGTGQGEDAEKLDARERAEWRRRSIEWFRNAAELWYMQVRIGSPIQIRAAARELRLWKCHVHLVAVREEAELSKLPVEEQELWRQFWAEVDHKIRVLHLKAKHR